MGYNEKERDALRQIEKDLENSEKDAIRRGDVSSVLDRADALKNVRDELNKK